MTNKEGAGASSKKAGKPRAAGSRGSGIAAYHEYRKHRNMLARALRVYRRVMRLTGKHLDAPREAVRCAASHGLETAVMQELEKRKAATGAWVERVRLRKLRQAQKKGIVVAQT